MSINQIITSLEKDCISYNLYTIAAKILETQKPDDSKNPNDFGFCKLCFPINLLENEVRDLDGMNIEKKLLDIKESILLSKIEKMQKTRSIEHFLCKDNEEIKTQADIKRNDTKNKNEIKNSLNKEANKKEAQAKKGYLTKVPMVDFYSQHTSTYNKFMTKYLQAEKSIAQKSNIGSIEKKKRFRQGDDIISYKERKEVIRKMMLNKMLNAELNIIDTDTKTQYENWKMGSKFNLLLSFIMYDSAKRAC